MSNARYIKHLYARAGFGIRFDDLHDEAHWSVKKAIHKLFKDSEDIKQLSVITENIDRRYHPNMTDEEKIEAQELRDTQQKTLNLVQLNMLSNNDAQLREKMTLFWLGHFADTNNPYHAQQLNNIQRANALGNFKTMVLQVSQAPGMLLFLNNQQNQKKHPNENFARELMELYTIGRGNYTEQDVRESARAFTGWAYDGKTEEFKFLTNVHDDGPKTFMGQTGNFCGEDIMEIIFSKKQTAVFICKKLYKYLVNEQPDDEHVRQMADVFYASHYEIKPLLEFVFTADWFYDDKNIGNLIKSPVELLAGLNRMFYVDYQDPRVLLQYQRALGQVLFQPPNVAGWPGGRAWIDSSSLMYRMRTGASILNAGLIDFTGKASPEDEAYLAAARKQHPDAVKKVQCTPGWAKVFDALPKDISNTQLAEIILEPKLNANIIRAVSQASDIKTAIIQIVSTPEYQMC